MPGKYAYCPGYRDRNGEWNNGFHCPKTFRSKHTKDSDYCCGDDHERFCCPQKNVPRKTTQPRRPSTTTVESFFVSDQSSDFVSSSPAPFFAAKIEGEKETINHMTTTLPPVSSASEPALTRVGPSTMSIAVWASCGVAGVLAIVAVVLLTWLCHPHCSPRRKKKKTPAPNPVCLRDMRGGAPLDGSCERLMTRASASPDNPDRNTPLLQTKWKASHVYPSASTLDQTIDTQYTPLSEDSTRSSEPVQSWADPPMIDRHWDHGAQLPQVNQLSFSQPPVMSESDTSWTHEQCPPRTRHYFSNLSVSPHTDVNHYETVSQYIESPQRGNVSIVTVV